MGPNQKYPRGNGGGGSNIGGSRPLSVEECFERYEKALGEVRQQSAEVFGHLNIVAHVFGLRINMCARFMWYSRLRMYGPVPAAGLT